jgi:hypothetical protein
MTEATSGAAAGIALGGRFSWMVAALATGISAGLLSDIIWPNPVYGYQIIIGGLAFLIGIAFGVVAITRPATRRLAFVVLSAAIGVIAGISLGFAARPSAAPVLMGSVGVDLASPVDVQVRTEQAICDIQGGQLAYLETPTAEGLELGDGRRLSVALTNALGLGGEAVPKPVGEAPAAVPALDIRVHWTLPDGSPTETLMAYGPGSNVTASGTAAAGSITFSGLVVSPLSEQRDRIDLAGTLRWECPAA